ncbi:MAG: NAD(P)-dependent dehydrogenase (short-subunit alcohol dehydrogenase family) [Flavobacteriales bacterium]|jgi:NAD(P)-dependent dehydrogenase (short-subunit alcohol dehydrogenase family)
MLWITDKQITNNSTMKKLENKTVFITGGLSGIGLECAIAAAKEGANIVVADIKSENTAIAMKEIRNENPQAIFIECDTSIFDQVQLAIEKTVSIFGTLDVALNNAGIGSSLNKVGNKNDTAWLKVIDVDLNGVVHIMHHELSQMAKQKNGVIVNMASIFGEIGMISSCQYGAAKDGVIELTLTSALEYATRGIRINAICPGFFNTPNIAKGGISGSAEVKEHITKNSTEYLLKKSEQIVNGFIFLSCDDSLFASGNILEIGGGYLPSFNFML